MDGAVADPNFQRQLDLEREMVSSGVAMYEERIEDAKGRGRFGISRPARDLIRVALQPVVEALKRFLAEASTGRAGARNVAARKLALIDPETAVFIAGRAILDKAVSETRLSSVAATVGRRIETELALRRFEAEKAGHYRRVLKKLDERTGDPHRRQRVMLAEMRSAGMLDERWTLSEAVHVGAKLIELYIQHTGICETRVARRGRREQVHELHLTDEAWKFLDARASKLSLMAPLYMPMVYPPKDWTGIDDGGYYLVREEAAANLRFIKANYPAYLEEAANDWDKMARAVEAVNIAQKTAWRINRRIYDVLIKAWEMSAFDNLLPRADDYELPEKPADIATNEEARKAYRRRAAAIHTKNAQLRPKRLLFLKLLWLADKFKDEPRFYFPYQLDFRGRIYPIPAFLTPQGNDVARALLEFAVGKPLGNARGVGWLAIHGANCFGIDKVSFEDRISWVYEHEEEILASAADPFSCGFWQTADDPFQFLAFCFEWEGYNREGVDYVSHIPVMLDGSCNGLQHYSALLRDYRGGKATNLVPAARPADIYSEVAAVARKRLEEEVAQSVCVPLDPDVEKRVRFARTWLKLGIDRKTTKRSVMTLPYGATFYACKEYVMDWADEAGHEAAFGADYVAACDYLAGVVWKSIGDVVVAAREAMEWLRSVARIMAKYGLPMQWTTPNGFRVFQAYFEDRYRRVKTKLGETLIWAVIPSFDNAKVSWRKQVNGIAPNFVHSLDATALQDYVLLASANGVNNCALVHDCYGTLAADTDMSVACLREAFVSLYETNDPLASLLEEVKAALPEEAHAELPPLPTRGALDISAVRESPYFFA